ncbi:hypothetical protein [Sporomusa aerivorans]|uniref:hypothetical protein n=1 Tax=Sporomusa aerivorans TaxID=204936 RepID=UPI00352A418C
MGSVKCKGVIYLLLIFFLMAGSTIAWLYFSPELPKKAPLRAKQVFLCPVGEHNIPLAKERALSFRQGSAQVKFSLA